MFANDLLGTPPPNGTSQGRRVDAEADRLREVGQRIAAHRRAKHWSRTTLAKAANVTVTTIRRCESGTHTTQPRKLLAICAALGTTPALLETEPITDPRVAHWTDEDYAVGSWFHHAPLTLKNQVWALVIGAPGAALRDARFLLVLETWPRLNPEQRDHVIDAATFFTTAPGAARPGVAAHEPVVARQKVRGLE